MKYSYMVRHKPERVKLGQCWIDSDERTIDFRNQYGEVFVLAPRKIVWITMLLCTIGGIFIGRFL